jgi:hypothetical protein
MSWELTGNPGTNPATNFLGTTDNEPLVIKTNGTERLRIDSAGNIGIGTTSPTSKLYVAASGRTALRIDDSGDGTPTTSYLSIWQGSVGAVIDPIGTGALYLGYDSPSDVYFGGSPANGIWKSTGNVGIGTTSPGAKLEVNGDVRVTGDVILTDGHADCAEEFDVAETVDIEPGTVMVLDQDGALHQSQQAYDKRVAGVISGAGDYKPGLILDRQQSHGNRLPVALVGKVYCKVDAQYASIEVGDMLTTSSTPGHAMKADDPFKAFGSVIGKALRGLESGQGLVPILVALQ